MLVEHNHILSTTMSCLHNNYNHHAGKRVLLSGAYSVTVGDDIC